MEPMGSFLFFYPPCGSFFLLRNYKQHFFTHLSVVNLFFHFMRKETFYPPCGSVVKQFNEWIFLPAFRQLFCHISDSIPIFYPPHGSFFYWLWDHFFIFSIFSPTFSAVIYFSFFSPKTPPLIIQATTKSNSSLVMLFIGSSSLRNLLNKKGNSAPVLTSLKAWLAS